jgi:hypothetical protein
MPPTWLLNVLGVSTAKRRVAIDMPRGGLERVRGAFLTKKAVLMRGRRRNRPKSSAMTKRARR